MRRTLFLGKKGMGTTEFRQHSSGHTPGPNWPTFLTFAARYFKSDFKRGPRNR